MPCPVDTLLTPIAICGAIQEVCAVGEPQDLRVAVTLLNPGGGLIKDPTNDSLVVAGLIFDETTFDSEDGCWSTCDLLPNYDSSGAGGALTPNTTGYRIQVIWGRTTVIDETIQIDAAGGYVLDDIDGACVNICTILGETPELPPPPSFCEAVLACVPGEVTTTLVNNGDGTYTYFNEAGTQVTIDICAAVNAFCPENLTTLVDNGDGSYTYTAEDGVVTVIAAPLPSTLTNNADGTWTHTADGISTIISSTSTDAGNVATVGTDGGTLITADDICGAVNANCPATVVTNADGTITITGTDDSTATTSLPTVNTDTFMLAVETTPGVFDFTNADGTAGVSIDVNEVIVSADANNIVTVGADGGAFVDCETIQDCVGTALAAVDGIVYDDAGNSITVTIVDSNGVPLVPNADGTYQLPPAAAGGTTSSVTDNGDGTFTHDDGAGNTVVWDVNSSTVTDNGDGTFTHDDGAGNTVVWDVNSSTVTDNGDGTFTHDDGTGTTTTWSAGSDVGQAVVTDNTDNTTTIAGTDTAGNVTTDTVINNLLRCDSTDLAPATDRLHTVDQLVADNKGFYIPFVDSGDGCTPADRTGCIDEAAVTYFCGSTWESAAGATSWTNTTPIKEIERSGASVGPTLDFSNTDPTAVNGDVIVPPVAATWTNPYCHDHDVLVINQVHHVDVIPIEGGPFRLGLQAEMRISTDGGASFTPFSSSVFNGGHHRYIRNIDGIGREPQNHDHPTVSFRAVTVGPKETLVAEGHAVLWYQNDDPTIDRWTMFEPAMNVTIVP